MVKKPSFAGGVLVAEATDEIVGAVVEEVAESAVESAVEEEIENLISEFAKMSITDKTDITDTNTTTEDKTLKWFPSTEDDLTELYKQYEDGKNIDYDENIIFDERMRSYGVKVQCTPAFYIITIIFSKLLTILTI